MSERLRLIESLKESKIGDDDMRRLQLAKRDFMEERILGFQIPSSDGSLIFRHYDDSEAPPVRTVEPEELRQSIFGKHWQFTVRNSSQESR